MIHTVFINGIDIYKEYGAFFDSSAFSALLTPPAMKDRLQYNSRLQNGKQVDTTHNRIADRDLTLTLSLTARNEAQFIDRYAAFCELLKSGTLNISTNIYSDVVYRCNYISCTQFTQFYTQMAKFSLKLNEPNPNDREPSEDVMFFCARADAIAENKGLIKSLKGYEVKDTEEYSAFNNVISESSAMLCHSDFELTFTIAKSRTVEIALKEESDSGGMGNVTIDGITHDITTYESVHNSEYSVYYIRTQLSAGTHTVTRPFNNPAMYMIYLNIEK